MKPILIGFVLIMLHVHFVFGQNVIKGRVCNNQNEPIPYTSIYDSIGGRGTYANINGYFNMAYEKLPVHLELSNVGYETKTIWVAKQEEIKVTLKEKELNLREVVIYSGEKPIKYVGSHKNVRRGGIFYVLDPFDQLGIVVNNQNNAIYKDPKWLSFSIKIQSGYILGFKIGNRPTGEPQLRLRLYEIGQNNMPGANLPHEEIILSPEKKGWYKVDLNSKYVQVPQEGFVMAVEWLENNPTYYYETKVQGHGNKKFTARQYGVGVRCHKMSEEEKKIYSPIRLLNFRQKRWEKMKYEYWKGVIPCFRLEFVELEE